MSKKTPEYNAPATATLAEIDAFEKNKREVDTAIVSMFGKRSNVKTIPKAAHQGANRAERRRLACAIRLNAYVKTEGESK